ncbi:hypothetical protein FPV67DRAFT_1606053 [Lyophyllum atratum]|nr:hypothetical protein FPV67DRAFT_1606053 [Lyophyllum atratum]
MTPTLHLNSTGCVIRHTDEKGRGVYASRAIPSQALIEISPVLFFSKEEYAEHGRFTVVDNYTFKWTDGRMALALGLGSLFNHSAQPNVSFSLDTANESIRYTTVRDTTALPEEADDGWGGLSAVGEDPDLPAPGPYLDGDPNEIITDEELPFTRFKLPPEEEELDSIRTVEAWVVDIPDPRHITKMLKWLKQTGFETPDLGHLKRIRKQNEMTTLLLATTTTSPAPPSPPPDLELPDPYTLLVPSSSALTPISLKLKSTFWPTLFTPSRKGEAEEWTRGKARWAWEAMQTVVAAAHEAHRTRRIAAHIAAPYDQDTGESVSLTPLSTQNRGVVVHLSATLVQSTEHPLRHAVINVIRQMAGPPRLRVDHPQASTCLRRLYLLHLQNLSKRERKGKKRRLRNGSNYLLTVAHLKEVVYLHPMPRTGGCGGAACLPTLKGINHRFSICQWKMNPGVAELHLDDVIDA